MDRPTLHGRGARGVALLVPVSQVGLALSGYVALALGARSLEAADFTNLTSFYLILNTVGRGMFAAVELEGSRALSAARARNMTTRPTVVATARRASIMFVIAAALSAITFPFFTSNRWEYVVLLVAGAAAMAVSYLVRGPLAATERFDAYAATFVVEAAAAAALSTALLLAEVTDPVVWVGVFVVSPLIAGLIALAWALRGRATVLEVAGQVRDFRPASLAHLPHADVRLAALLWTALFYLSSQGVWNLAPVLVSARLAERPSAAAGFVAAAVVLRAPVFVFPALQAVLLPSVSAMAQTDDQAGIRRALRPLLALLLGSSVIWVAAAVFVVPSVAELAFAVTETPATPVLVALALSTLFGAVAFILQTRLLAYRRHRAVATGWFLGLAAVLVVAVLPGDGETIGALAQLSGGLVVAVAIVLIDRRARSRTVAGA